MRNQLTQVPLEGMPLNWCVCVCVCLYLLYKVIILNLLLITSYIADTLAVHLSLIHI